MTAKEYLSQAHHFDQRIDAKIAQVASLNELATKCTATLTGMPRNPNRGGSTMADAALTCRKKSTGTSTGSWI